MRTIHYSDGRAVPFVIVVREDFHTARSGYFRAFWMASPESDIGSPVIGYCSPGGSHRTIRAVAAEVWRLYPGETVYRYGRPVKERTNFGPGAI